MIKYLGSKRRLVPVLGAISAALGTRTATDLFTGTTRVAQELKRQGAHVTTVDVATYSEILSQCYITLDAADTNPSELTAILTELNALPGTPGYFTDMFCEQARYIQPKNGARIDAIRNHLADHYQNHMLYPVLLTALMLAADRVDSTTGMHMAYLKQWAPRSDRDLHLTAPALLTGTGTTLRGNTPDLLDALPHVDLAYLDPPYNQHRYYTNYHLWETLIRWDHPEAYGIARKRIDSRDPLTKSVFNSKPAMPAALRDTIARTRATTVLVSYNNESWITAADMTDALHTAGHEHVRLLGYDSRRYVGSLIGGHDLTGTRVSAPGPTRNLEWVFIAGPTSHVNTAVAAAEHVRPSTEQPTSHQ